MPKLISVVLVLTVLTVTPIARAGLGDEATITVVEEGAAPEDVVKVIELPPPASATAATKSAFGTDAASSAKDKSAGGGHEFGQEISEDAHSRDMSDQVRSDAREQGKNETRNDNAGSNRHGPH
jgi:hypothetical protein